MKTTVTGTNHDDTWEGVCAQVDAAMRRISRAKHPRWHVDGYNLGWRGRRGSMSFHADTAHRLLLGFLPRTECSFRIEVDTRTRRLTVYNAQHDQEAERYEIRPVR